MPSYVSEWFWWYWQGQPQQSVVDFIHNNFPPGVTYADFAPQFTAELWDPAQWADIFHASGAKYIVLTSKHHEGFTNWRSNVSWNWNAVDVGPKRDLVGDLAQAVRNRNLHFGLYHSLFEWFNPLYKYDADGKFATQLFVKGKTLPELYEIVNAYHPEIIWSDGDAGPDVYWNSTQFLAWLYNESPVRDYVVTNDRWGTGIGCKHGGFFTCADRFHPSSLVKHKWESCMTIDKNSWGYRREMQLSDTLSTRELVQVLVQTVAYNGNLLLNVGPTRDGRIDVVFEQRLREMGSWLNVNGEAIYNSTYWTFQNDTINPDVYYTLQNGTKTVYAMTVAWPSSGVLVLGAPQLSASSKISLLGYLHPITFSSLNPGVRINVPSLNVAQMPCDFVWTFKLENLLNSERDDELVVAAEPRPRDVENASEAEKKMQSYLNLAKRNRLP